MTQTQKAAEYARLEEREAVVSLLAHVAEQYADGRQIERLIAKIVAGCGEAILAGIHRLPAERWPMRPMPAEDEDETSSA